MTATVNATGRARLLMPGAFAGLLLADVTGGLVDVAAGRSGLTEAWSSRATLCAPWPMIAFQAVSTAVSVRSAGLPSRVAADLLAVGCGVSIASGFFDGQRGRSALGRQSVGMERATSVLVRWLAAGDRGDVDAFDALMHADAVVHAPRGLSTESSEAKKRVWLDALAAMPDLRHEVQEVIVEADTEMARVVVTGTLFHGFAGVPGNGRSFRMDQAVICHLRDGKITEAWEIADVASLVEQVT